jgi:hypothetical protein
MPGAGVVHHINRDHFTLFDDAAIRTAAQRLARVTSGAASMMELPDGQF